jgi:hypothetical protein
MTARRLEPEQESLNQKKVNPDLAKTVKEKNEQHNQEAKQFLHRKVNGFTTPNHRGHRPPSLI